MAAPAPYDYTQAKDAADDIDYSPDQYDDFELLEPEDFLKTITIHIELEECF